MKTVAPVKVMFLCTGNSCRSQTAEGLARELGRGMCESFSAGLMAAGLHPKAVEVMAENGIDISRQTSKEVNEDLVGGMDLVITLCASAEEACPRTPPEVERLHWPVRDPVGTRGSRDEVLKEFRRTRDEIRGRIEELLKMIRRREQTETWAGRSFKGLFQTVL